MTRKLQIIFISFLLLVSIKFFDAQFIDDSLINYALYLFTIVAVAISIPYIVPKNRGFVFVIQLLLISFVVSIFMANIFWDQSLVQSIIATAPYLVVIFFFFLLQVKFPVETLEKIIVAYGVLYILLYFFQLANAPTVLFGKSLWGEEFTTTRGIVRIIFPGGGIFVLTSFVAVNKLTSKSGHQWFWFLMALFGILIPILQVTRQFIAGILLLYLYHAIRNFSITKKTLILVTSVIAVIIVMNLDIPVIEGLIESTQNDADEGGDYIRILAGEYFLFDFSPETIPAIFGNGVPYTGVSNYGIFVDMLGIEQYYFLSDVGLITVYAQFGVLAILAFALIWIMSFIVSVPKDYYYLKYYLWFVLMTSLTWYSTYHQDYLLITVFVLYMYQMVGYTRRAGPLQPQPKENNEKSISSRQNG